MDADFNAREADILACARPAHLALRVLDGGWITSEHGFDLLYEGGLQLVALPSFGVHVYAMYPKGLRPELGYLDVLVRPLPDYLTPRSLRYRWPWLTMPFSV